MLAQNFKTPAALGIKDVEFDALVKVLGMLERGELVAVAKDNFGLTSTEPIQNGFDMSCIRRGNSSCQTVGCIMGWCQIISQRDDMFYGYDLSNVMTERRALQELFMFGSNSRYGVKPAQAAIALRSYLTHGEARWHEALSCA